MSDEIDDPPIVEQAAQVLMRVPQHATEVTDPIHLSEARAFARALHAVGLLNTMQTTLDLD